MNFHVFVLLIILAIAADAAPREDKSPKNYIKAKRKLVKRTQLKVIKTDLLLLQTVSEIVPVVYC